VSDAIAIARINPSIPPDCETVSNDRTDLSHHTRKD